MKIRDRIGHTQKICPGFDTLLHYDGKPRSRITLAFIQEHQLAIMVYGTIPLYWRGRGSFLGFQKGIKQSEWEMGTNLLEMMKSKE